MQRQPHSAALHAFIMSIISTPALNPQVLSAHLIWQTTVNQALILTGWTTGWSESAVTWSGQPNLATLSNGAVVNSVASNFLLVRT